MLILQQSYQLFKTSGYDKTTTRDIAAACGMKRGLLHYYYPKKQDILFDIYADFLNHLVDFTRASFHHDDAELTIVMIDKIYYEYVFYNRDLLSILVNILENRELTQVKVAKTMAIFEKIYAQDSEPFDRDQLFIAMAAAIGAEVELLLNLISGNIEISVDELLEGVLKIVAVLRGLDPQLVEQRLIHVRQDYDRMELADLDKYLKANCSWYS